MFDVPANQVGSFPTIIAPVHWENHWALLIADRSTGRVYYLDSFEAKGRRQMAVASMRNNKQATPTDRKQSLSLAYGRS
jgi:hypothetical protein